MEVALCQTTSQKNRDSKLRPRKVLCHSVLRISGRNLRAILRASHQCELLNRKEVFWTGSRDSKITFKNAQYLCFFRLWTEILRINDDENEPKESVTPASGNGRGKDRKVIRPGRNITTTTTTTTTSFPSRYHHPGQKYGVSVSKQIKNSTGFTPEARPKYFEERLSRSFFKYQISNVKPETAFNENSRRRAAN